MSAHPLLKRPDHCWPRAAPEIPEMNVSDAADVVTFVHEDPSLERISVHVLNQVPAGCLRAQVYAQVG